MKLAVLLALVVLMSACIEPIADPVNDTPIDSADPSYVEAESFTIGSGFTQVDNSRYSGSKALQATATRGSASGSISGTGMLQAAIYGPSASEDALYIIVDGTSYRKFPSSTEQLEWVDVASIDGATSIRIEVAETGAVIDALRIIDVSAEPDESDETVVGPSGTTDERTYMSLRGDPSFSRSDLSGELQDRYDAFWYALDNGPTEGYSQSSNQYTLGRSLFMDASMAEMVFRQTGDLNILDRLYEFSKNTYDSLDDSWTPGTISPYYDTHLREELRAEDGYRNWRYEYSCEIGGSDRYCGRDNHRLEEPLSHGHAAQTMYMLHMNRDLQSPSGYEYGALADNWLDYMRTEYEPKWRDRYERDWPEMPYLSRYFTHTNTANLKATYYVGRMLEDLENPDANVYLDYANVMIDEMFTEPHIPSGSDEQAGGYIETSTPHGPAYIWAFGTPYNRGLNSVSAAPTTYARYTLAMAAQLHFDGAPRFEDPAVMDRFANTVAYFILDTEPSFGSRTEIIAADVIGGDGDGEKYVDGMQGTSYRGRTNTNRYIASTFGLYALWDDTGRIEAVTDEAARVASGRSVSVPLHAFRFVTEYDKQVN